MCERQSYEHVGVSGNYSAQLVQACELRFPLPGAQFVRVQMNKQEATNFQNMAGCESD